MARIHGRNGRLYVAVASGGTAEPIAYLKSFSLNFSVDSVDQTAFGDTNKVKTAGLPDATGSYSGWYDSASAQLYTAATDGVARKFYLYPTTADTGTHFSGTAIFDMSISQAVDGGVEISGDFEAASNVTKTAT